MLNDIPMSWSKPPTFVARRPGRSVGAPPQAEDAGIELEVSRPFRSPHSPRAPEKRARSFPLGTVVFPLVRKPVVRLCPLGPGTPEARSARRATGELPCPEASQRGRFSGCGHWLEIRALRRVGRFWGNCPPGQGRLGPPFTTFFGARFSGRRTRGSRPGAQSSCAVLPAGSRLYACRGVPGAPRSSAFRSSFPIAMSDHGRSFHAPFAQNGSRCPTPSPPKRAGRAGGKGPWSGTPRGMLSPGPPVIICTPGANRPRTGTFPGSTQAIHFWFGTRSAPL